MFSEFVEVPEALLLDQTPSKGTLQSEPGVGTLAVDLAVA
jgi:hypothetical protein